MALLCAVPPAQASDASVSPRDAYFDSAQVPTLSFSLRTDAPADVRIQVVNRSTGEVVRGWLRKRIAPGRTYEQRWSGLDASGDVAPDGPYKFVVRAKAAKRNAGVAKFRLHSYVFPIPGPHAYRGGLGDFGAPREGGRIHQGKDVWAGCGQELIALRGGRVQGRGFDPVLYGNYLILDARKTRTDYFYAHMLSPATVADGARVRTGEQVGAVGKTGNAESVGCMMHLEVWPDGYHHGEPVDPEPLLRLWDGWS